MMAEMAGAARCWRVRRLACCITAAAATGRSPGGRRWWVRCMARPSWPRTTYMYPWSRIRSPTSRPRLCGNGSRTELGVGVRNEPRFVSLCLGLCWDGSVKVVVPSSVCAHPSEAAVSCMHSSVLIPGQPWVARPGLGMPMGRGNNALVLIGLQLAVLLCESLECRTLPVQKAVLAAFL